MTRRTPSRLAMRAKLSAPWRSRSEKPRPPDIAWIRKYATSTPPQHPQGCRDQSRPLTQLTTSEHEASSAQRVAHQTAHLHTRAAQRIRQATPDESSSTARAVSWRAELGFRRVLDEPLDGTPVPAPSWRRIPSG